MKIYSAKRDDIMRERDEWDSRRQELEDRAKEEHHQYLEAYEAAIQPIKSYLNKNLAKFDLLDFEINVKYRDSLRNSGFRVDIQCNQNKIHDESSALSWRYSVEFYANTGEIIRDSSSWSGLQVTTSQQLESLQQTADALKFLLSVDWADVLSVVMPEWDDYHKTRSSDMGKRPDFENQLIQAEIEDAIGENVVFHGNIKYDASRTWTRGWLQFIRETPKKYKINFISDQYLSYAMHKYESDDEVETLGQLLSKPETYANQLNVWKRDIATVVDNPIQKLEF